MSHRHALDIYYLSLPWYFEDCKHIIETTKSGCAFYKASRGLSMYLSASSLTSNSSLEWCPLSLSIVEDWNQELILQRRASRKVAPTLTLRLLVASNEHYNQLSYSSKVWRWLTLLLALY